jgi:hypothetical protein
MSQSRPLDIVIRKIERGFKNESDAAKIVIIDCRKKKAVPRPPIFGPVKYYLVSNTDDARHTAECRGPLCAVADFETGREINICVNYQARVRSGSEQQVAEALFSDSHPGIVLDGLLRKWVAAFTSEDPGAFINNYYQSQKDLQKYILREAEREAGLTLKVSLSLDGEEALAKFNVGPTRTMVRLKDSDQEQELKLTAELVVDETDKVNAILSMHAEERLESIVVGATRAYLVEHVSLHQFCTEINGDGFKVQLREHLDESLSGKGRRVGYLSLESPATALVPDDKKFFELKHPVKCDIPEFPDPIEINNTLQMKLTNVALYQAISPIDPAEWIKKALDRVIREELFGKKYINLLLNFREPEKDSNEAESNGGAHAGHNGSGGSGGSGGEAKIASSIKEKMREQAAAIGYRLEQLISQPSLAPYKLLDNFTIEPSGTFATRVSDVHVKLQIAITAKINDLMDVKDYLNRQEDVRKAMCKTALAEAGQYLHGIDPSDFYMNFSFSKDVSVPTVEESLAERIRTKLEEQFKARVVSIVPKQLDDKLIERLKNLQRALYPFTAEVNPLRSGEKFIFEGDFQIVGVHENGWYIFQSRDASIAEVKATAEKNIRAYLATCSDEELRHPPGGLDVLRREVEQDVNARLMKGYGLVMSITTFFRNRTESEEGVSRVEAEHTQEKLKGLSDSIASFGQLRESQKAQLLALLKRREEIIISEESGPELVELDEKIRDLQEQLAANSKKLIKQQIVKARAETLPDTMRLKHLRPRAGTYAKALPAAAEVEADEAGGEFVEEEE